MPQIQGSAPQDHTHFRCQSQVVGPWVPHTSAQNWLQIRGSHESLPGFNNLYNGPQNSGKHIYQFVTWYKEHEYPKYRIQINIRQRGTQGESRSFCSQGVGMCHPPSTWMYSSTPETLHTLGIFTMASPHRLHHIGIWEEDSSGKKIHLLTQSQPISPLMRMHVGAESSKIPITAWSFWWPLPIKESTENHLIRTKTLLSPRTFQGI